MEKKIIISSKHKYHLLNPYYGGAKAHYYKEKELKNLTSEQGFLKHQTTILQLFLLYPVQPN